MLFWMLAWSAEEKATLESHCGNLCHMDPGLPTCPMKSGNICSQCLKSPRWWEICSCWKAELCRVKERQHRPFAFATVRISWEATKAGLFCLFLKSKINKKARALQPDDKPLDERLVAFAHGPGGLGWDRYKHTLPTWTEFRLAKFSDWEYTD